MGGPSVLNHGRGRHRHFGASGAIYGKRLAEVLSDMGKTVRLVVTDSGKITLKHECDTTLEAVAEATDAILEDAKNVGAKSASGSAKIDAVGSAPVLAPPSASSLPASPTTW